MAAELVNLRQARKRRTREEAEKQADSNRLKFGRVKGERAATAVENRRKGANLAGKRLDKDR